MATLKDTKITNQLTVAQGIELGDGSAPKTPYIDFHTASGNPDYDTRIIGQDKIINIQADDLRLNGHSVFSTDYEELTFSVNSNYFTDDGSHAYRIGNMVYFQCHLRFAKKVDIWNVYLVNEFSWVPIFPYFGLVSFSRNSIKQNLRINNGGSAIWMDIIESLDNVPEEGSIYFSVSFLGYKRY